jgi:2-polyprenyl-6-methoxyphenol hydroxylase-like FAD-dependent oxidoreductase
LVILGDSACAFNPVYGQGMTVGILQAKALGTIVSEALEAVTSNSAAGGDVASRRAALSGVSQKQMRQLGDVLRFPWAVATGADAPFLPDFNQSPGEAFIAGYLDEVRA